MIEWRMYKWILNVKLLLNEFQFHLQFFLLLFMNVTRLDEIGDSLFLFIYVFF
jgi:hypothetical protein